MQLDLNALLSVVTWQIAISVKTLLIAINVIVLIIWELLQLDVIFKIAHQILVKYNLKIYFFSININLSQNLIIIIAATNKCTDFTNRKCFAVSGNMTNCYNCSSSTFCFKCSNSYYLSTDSSGCLAQCSSNPGIKININNNITIIIYLYFH